MLDRLERTRPLGARLSATFKPLKGWNRSSSLTWIIFPSRHGCLSRLWCSSLHLGCSRIRDHPLTGASLQRGSSDPLSASFLLIIETFRLDLLLKQHVVMRLRRTSQPTPGQISATSKHMKDWDTTPRRATFNGAPGIR